MPNQFDVDQGVVVPDGPQQWVALPFTPDALVFWWAPSRGVAGVAPNAGGRGFAARGYAGRAVGWVSADGLPATRASSWRVESSAVLHLGEAEPELDGEVVLGSGGFSLGWRRWSNAWDIHYVALAGVEAHVGWLEAATGSQACDGVGFRPDLVLLAPTAAGPPRETHAGLVAGIGAVSAHAQAACGYLTPDGAPPGGVRGAQRSGVAVVVPVVGKDSPATAVAQLTTDGFSLIWRDLPATGLGCGYLAVRGLRCAVGVTTSPRAPGARRTARVGFRPQALICASWGLAPSEATKPIGRLSLGAATATASGCAGWDDRNVPSALTASHAHSSDDHVVLVADSQTGGWHAAASLRRVDADGFTLHWQLSDRIREVVFIAMAASGGGGAVSVAARTLLRMARWMARPLRAAVTEAARKRLRRGGRERVAVAVADFDGGEDGLHQS